MVGIKCYLSPVELQKFRQKALHNESKGETVASIIGYRINNDIIVTSIIDFPESAYLSRNSVHAKFEPAYAFFIQNLVPCFRFIGLIHFHPIRGHSEQDNNNLKALGNGMVSLVDNGCEVFGYVNLKNRIRQIEVILNYKPPYTDLKAIFSKGNDPVCVFYPDSISDTEASLMLQREYNKLSPIYLKIAPNKYDLCSIQKGDFTHTAAIFPVYAHINNSFVIRINCSTGQTIKEIANHVLSLLGKEYDSPIISSDGNVLNMNSILTAEFNLKQISLYQ